MAHKTVNEHKVIFRAHDTSGRTVRVWRESWPGDVFEVMPSDELNEMIQSAESLMKFFPALLFEEADDSEIEIYGLYASPLLIMTLSKAEVGDTDTDTNTGDAEFRITNIDGNT